MGKYQRDKGSRSERELCALLRDSLGIDVRRNLGQERDSGNDIDLPGFAVEVKRRARIAGVYDWLRQAEDAETGVPVVAMRADRGGWLVVMRLEDWIPLAREEIVAKMPVSGVCSPVASSSGEGDGLPMPEDRHAA